MSARSTASGEILLRATSNMRGGRGGGSPLSYYESTVLSACDDGDHLELRLVSGTNNLTVTGPSMVHEQRFTISVGALIDLIRKHGNEVQPLPRPATDRKA